MHNRLTPSFRKRSSLLGSGLVLWATSCWASDTAEKNKFFEPYLSLGHSTALDFGGTFGAIITPKELPKNKQGYALSRLDFTTQKWGPFAEASFYREASKIAFGFGITSKEFDCIPKYGARLGLGHMWVYDPPHEKFSARSYLGPTLSIHLSWLESSVSQYLPLNGGGASVTEFTFGVHLPL